MVELRLRKARQVGASREVLPQEQIGVFVAAALPGTLWIAEVDLHIRGHPAPWGGLEADKTSGRAEGVFFLTPFIEPIRR
jgi:hypothetical protein